MAQVETQHVESHLKSHYHDLGQQAHAAQLGMWVFLASEVLFFGALFVLYAASRARWPHAFAAAADHTTLFLGTANTYVLVLASWLVAMAVGTIRKSPGGRSREARRAALLLGGAAVLGALFLILKAWEYGRHFREGIFPGAYYHFDKLPGPGAEAFFNLYYLMTGLHALHVTGGIVMLSWLAMRARRGAYDGRWHTPLELGGMYWHFVDIVWLFLWPIFYLMRA